MILRKTHATPAPRCQSQQFARVARCVPSAKRGQQLEVIAGVSFGRTDDNDAVGEGLPERNPRMLHFFLIPFLHPCPYISGVGSMRARAVASRGLPIMITAMDLVWIRVALIGVAVVAFIAAALLARSSTTAANKLTCVGAASNTIRPGA